MAMANKLMNNFDLMERVNEANGKFQLNKVLIASTNFTVPFFAGFGLADSAIRPNHQIAWLNNLAISSCIFLGFAATRTLVDRKNKDISQFFSYLDLTVLSNQLANIDVKTSADFLAEAEVVQTNYKPFFTNGKPMINQNKYILVPTYDELGTVRETLLLQEHQFGSEEYILSVDSPVKLQKTIPVFNV